ncbi:MAG: hypothetical protein QOF77_12 [Solirubrobacteraceae bacterium]|jgi:hypothetical protein|nr:hypothetical protein [Solirubrobacteraceae bacterium]
MEPAAAVTILAVVIIVLLLVVYLVAIIGQLKQITADLDVVIGAVLEIVRQTGPVNAVVITINQQLDAGVDLLEGLLVKKAGMQDALGLVEGMYPGSAADGFRRFGRSRNTKVPRIGEVYTKGTLTLARLGREAPIAAGNPGGPALRNAVNASSQARTLYPDPRRSSGSSRDNLPKSPTIGSASPNQYEPTSSPGARSRMPAREAAEESGFSIRPPSGHRQAAPAPAPAPAAEAPPADAPPAETGAPQRFSAISKRPWET